MAIYVISAYVPSKSPLHQLTHHGTNSSQHPIFFSPSGMSYKAVEDFVPNAPNLIQSFRAIPEPRGPMWETTWIDGWYQQNTSGKGYVEGKVGG